MTEQSGRGGGTDAAAPCLSTTSLLPSLLLLCGPSALKHLSQASSLSAGDLPEAVEIREVDRLAEPAKPSVT